MNTRKLTKSLFLEYCQCPERLKKSLILPRKIDEATENILQNGNEVGLLARGLFPTGIEIGASFMYENRYQDLIIPGNVYFEPPFRTLDLLARVDVLSVLPDGSLKISEVKSTTEFKEKEHLPDNYFQKRVVEEATGVKVSEIELIHINKEYVFNGTWDIQNYFKIVKLPFQEEIQAEINLNIDDCLNYLRVGFPEFTPGPQCKKPHICPHFDICNSKNHTILNLRRGGNKSWEFLNKGIKRISDVTDVSLLTPFQLKQFESEKFQKPIIDFDQLREFLNKVTYPCSFLDFEGFSTPIIHELGLLEIKPYSQIVFQADLKISNSERETDLQEYSVISIPNIDPRRQVADFLNFYLPDTGSVFVYFKNYEVSRLMELAHLFPEYKNKFNLAIERIIDLEEVFSRGIYVDYRFEGSASVKKVLGIVCEDMASAYSDLNLINNGQLANIKYLQYYKGILPFTDHQIVLNSLKRYCSLDVYSLWKILNQLRRLHEKSRK